jgi:dynein heavy chain
LRFFNTLYISELEQESITLIFSEITKGIFRRYKLKSEVMDLIDGKAIVNSTLSLYEMAKLKFLPTPAKSHYLFNIRDVSKVIQGISMIKPTSLASPDNLVKLWVHEFERVFEDRLVSEEDKQFVKE